ncbi:MAG: DegT/DnrJ/EryC1/StrS aminotransferase family protein [Chloroflexi bacterium]|nr:DegT/DnrJ/EryC1/StrS aminotransferase family protein [Chloroflexota bacterium]
MTESTPPAAVEPFLPFAQPEIGQEEIDEVVDTLRSGWLTGGPKVQAFEESFREVTGASHAVALSSCTAGMHLALLAAGIGPGDEVITTPLTFAATVNVILHAGATPVLADVREDDYNIDVDEIERKITPRTKALLPVHYGGQPCRMDELQALADRHKLRVIEDAAHAIGASYRGQPIGALTDAAVFSFYPIKAITTGQGGMLTTNDADLAGQVRLLSLHGLSKNAWNRYSKGGSAEYQVLAPGFNYAMTDIQAALGIHQLKRLEAFQARRTHIANQYNALFADVPELIRPPMRGEIVHAWHLYPIRLQLDRLTIDRAQFIEELRERGIGTSVHFIPIHLHPYYREALSLGPGDFPVTEAIYEGLISLPIYPRMEDADVERVAAAVREIAGAHRRPGR